MLGCPLWAALVTFPPEMAGASQAQMNTPSGDCLPVTNTPCPMAHFTKARKTTACRGSTAGSLLRLLSMTPVGGGCSYHCAGLPDAPPGQRPPGSLLLVPCPPAVAAGLTPPNLAQETSLRTSVLPTVTSPLPPQNWFPQPLSADRPSPL